MEKETKILIGASALALAYYLYNASKAAAVTPIGTMPMLMPPITTPVSPMVTIPVIPMVTTPVKVSPAEPNYDDSISKAKAKEAIAAKIAADEADTKAAQVEIDKLAQEQYIQNLRDADEARNKANQLAYQTYLAEVAAQAAVDKAAEDKIIADRQKSIDKAAADAAAREKAMNAFLYPTCPDGFVWEQYQCQPTYIVQERKVTEQANRGEGLILRDMYKGGVSLVQSCPAEYVKQGIYCIPRYSLSPQELQVMAMQDAGMVQTSDGQWYLDAKSAASAQSIIDATKSIPKYSARQLSINDAICSITTAGVVNNPYSSATNGMSLTQYIGQYKVTAGELNIARASCPNSVYSSGRIAGGGTDDNALGYKEYLSPIVDTSTKTAVEPSTKPCELVYSNCGLPSRYETIQIPWNADCSTYQPARPQCAPPQQWF